ncbi:MAG: hypothetical protein LBC41_16395, partial [Clostridiales bacterium]|nr:hypothetical protein [Clostridiales bacterium]
IKGDVLMPQSPGLPQSWTDMATLKERGEYKVSLLLDGYDYTKFNGTSKDLKKIILVDLTATSSADDSSGLKISMPLRYHYRQVKINGKFLQAYDYPGSAWRVDPIVPETEGELRVTRNGAAISSSFFGVRQISASLEVRTFTSDDLTAASGIFDMAICAKDDAKHFAAEISKSSDYVVTQRISEADLESETPIFEIAAALPYGYALESTPVADFSDFKTLFRQAEEKADSPDFDYYADKAETAAQKTVEAKIIKTPKPWFRAWIPTGAGASS